MQDLRYGARMLGKSPGLTAVAVFALALGIGANTAIFSVVNAVLLNPLPFPQPERLVAVSGTHSRQGGSTARVSYPDFADLQEQNGVFEHFAAYDAEDFNVVAGGESERIRGAVVSASLFPALGAAPIQGRAFAPDEDRPGAAPVVVVAHGLWQRKFGGDPNLVGKALTVEGEPATVVGIMPADFRFPIGPEPVEMWAPMRFYQTFYAERGARGLDVVGRLGPGVTLAGARAEIDAVAARLAEQYPDSNRGWGVRIDPLHERLVGGVRPALFVLLGAVGCVLLIACANVANLLLVRASARRKEMAVRAALGASRWRLARGLLAESALLALLGGALGLLLAAWGADLLVSAGPGDLPRLSEVGLDTRVLLFTLLVSLSTGVGFGLVPALQATKTELSETLKDGGSHPSARAGGNRVRSLLVVSEVALALVLLVGAGLLIKSFARLLGVDPGFRPDDVVTMQLALSDANFTENHQVVSFYDRILARVRSVPGVESAGLVTTLPLGKGAIGLTYEVEGQPPATAAGRTSAAFDVVSPGYFRTLGIPLLGGRDFSDRDREDSPPVVVVSESLARRAWPGEEAIGKRLTVSASDDEGPPPLREVVGIVGDVKHRGLDADARETIYVPYTHVPWPGVFVAARTEADAAGVAALMRNAVREVDPDQPVYNVRVMTQVVADSVARPRLYMALLGIFALVALALAAVGLYGVMSYAVAQRTHEIGVRMALGARQGDVLRLVVGHGMGLALAGVGIGLVAALGLTRLLAGLLFGVTATDPLTFGLIALLLAGTAFLACYVPARRATRVDPIVALRYE